MLLKNQWVTEEIKEEKKFLNAWRQMTRKTEYSKIYEFQQKQFWEESL